MDERVKGCENLGIIEASHIIIRAGCHAVRIVLRRNNDHEFVVHRQILRGIPFDPKDGSCGFEHVDFIQGNYFGYGNKNVPPGCLPIEESAALIAAAKMYNERVKAL